jgi:hypothetical protein
VRDAKLPKGCGVKPITRLPIRWREALGRVLDDADGLLARDVGPDEPGPGSAPVAIVWSGVASAAASTRTKA